jgi:hypothetical protein
MPTPEQLEKIKKLSAEVKITGGPCTPPSTYWITITNVVGNGSTIIVVPQGGNLWLCYEAGNAQASYIVVWHQGGSTTPVQLGNNNIPVGPGDMIWYVLGNPATDAIKLGYQIT